MSRTHTSGVKALGGLIESYAHRHVHPTSVKAATAHFAQYVAQLPQADKARLGGDRKSLGILADSWFSKDALAVPGVAPREQAEDKGPNLALAQDHAARVEIGGPR